MRRHIQSLKAVENEGKQKIAFSVSRALRILG
jgi:hypothetical protein